MGADQVVSTKLSTVTRILAAEKCGIAVDESPEAVAAGLKRLILDRETQLLMGKNAQAAVRARYRWEDESKKILTSVRELSGSRF